MIDGLIYDDHGRMILAIIWLVLGAPFWCFLMISTSGLRKASDLVLAVAAARGGSPWFRQWMQWVVQRRRMRFWALVFAAFTVAPPILFLAGRFVVRLVTESGPVFWVGGMLLGGALIALGAWWMLRAREGKPVEPTPYVLDETPQPVPLWEPVPPEFWSAPPIAGNWTDPQA